MKRAFGFNYQSAKIAVKLVPHLCHSEGQLPQQICHHYETVYSTRRHRIKPRRYGIVVRVCSGLNWAEVAMEGFFSRLCGGPNIKYSQGTLLQNNQQESQISFLWCSLLRQLGAGFLCNFAASLTDLTWVITNLNIYLRLQYQPFT